MARSLVPALLALAVGGCSLILDFDREGLACDADGLCSEGYTCTATNTCLPDGHPDTVCTGCSSLETCFRAKCVPVCDGRACPAGSTCSEGVCRVAKRDQKIGAPCDADSDCTAPGLCLRPYGGGTGVCTRTCTAKSECGNVSLDCLPYRSSENDLRICAPPSFVACDEEADCAPSGLSCGVYALSSATQKAPIVACRARTTTGSIAGIGELCSPSVPCVNGLCVRVSGTGETRCTTPCADKSACEKTLESSTLACAHVTLEPTTTTLPRVRPLLCVDGGASMLFPCAAMVTTCRADAPYCADLSGTGEFKCVTPCGEGSNRCPATGARYCATLTIDEESRDVCRP